MKDAIQYLNDDQLDILDFFREGRVRLSVRRENHGKPDALVFLHANDRQLLVRCQPVEVSERFEVGVIRFALYEETFPGATEVGLVLDCSEISAIKRLIFRHGQQSIDTGMAIFSEHQLPIIVTGGAILGSLAIQSSGLILADFEPEFELSDYSLGNF